MENSDPEICPVLRSASSAVLQSKNSDFTSFTNDSSNTYIVSLVDFLKDRCKDDFLKQDYVVEVRKVHLRKREYLKHEPFYFLNYMINDDLLKCPFFCFQLKNFLFILRM